MKSSISQFVEMISLIVVGVLIFGFPASLQAIIFWSIYVLLGSGLLLLKDFIYNGKQESTCKPDGYRTKRWYNNQGQLHRLDGPAVCANGYKAWYQNDKLHRLDGHAVEHPDGDKKWYQNGKLHRLDGPAVEYANGNKLYWVEGKEYSEEDFTKKFGEVREQEQESTCEVDEYGHKRWYNKQGQFHRLYGPAIEWANGYKAWFQNGKRHRLDGPAIECANGDKFWFQNGKLHRLDGPAVEWASGSKEWYQNGKLHRLDGPAIEYSDGDKFWYKNGKCLF